jgi:DNA-binding CsgD family transcriptional regulator
MAAAASSRRAAMGRQLRDVQQRFDIPVLFGGEGSSDGIVLSDFAGTRTNALRGLVIQQSLGLGGRAMVTGLPCGVDDYSSASTISHEYDQAVRREGLWSVFVAPVKVLGTTQALLYAATRRGTGLGDRAKLALARAARGLATELAVLAEVERRLVDRQAEATMTRSAPPWSQARLERLRSAHAELRAITSATADPELRQRLHHLSGTLTDIMSDQPDASTLQLSPRELDVVAQISLGCSNAEAAARLALRPETVKAYLRSAMRKLDAHTRFEAVVNARRCGLLP